MNNTSSAYGLWPLVITNTVMFAAFIFSFSRPRNSRDWRSFGALSAFLVALFTEMYGIPLTIYALSGWLQKVSPDVDLLSHENGHLWQALLGFQIDPHLNPLHLMSTGLIVSGFLLLAAAWNVLYEAQRTDTLATGGPYRYIRHPQYVAFTLIMLGLLLQWPTLLTLLMFPVLVTMYVRLARREEREMRNEFGDVYGLYTERTPPIVPRLAPARSVA